MFVNGRFPIAISAWLGPALMLPFVRVRRGMMGLTLTYIGLSFAFGYQFYGMTPFTGVAYVVFSAVLGITLLLPNEVNCYLGTRYDGLAQSLVFPLTLVTSEYLATRTRQGLLSRLRS
jgi:hypothetical protein